MILTLIGMSNVGKTYWSQRLVRELGFTHFCCDAIIEEKLHDQLVQLGYKGLADMAKWMGFPYEKKYNKTSSQYLSLEKNTMQEILAEVYSAKSNQNIVIDTTGSVIYTGEEIMKKLRSVSKVVYLDTPREEQEQMFKSFIAEPKPVIWGNSFTVRHGEDNLHALSRSYKELLAFRTNQYKRHAHVTVPFHEFRNQSFSVTSLLSYAL